MPGAEKESWACLTWSIEVKEGPFPPAAVGTQDRGPLSDQWFGP